MNYAETYDDGYAIGFNEGMIRGYADGYEACGAEYEQRIRMLNIEITCLNARIDRLQTLFDTEIQK